MRHAQAIDEEVPVLIVGGGGAGLTASMLLARMGACENPLDELAAALGQILARPIPSLAATA